MRSKLVPPATPGDPPAGRILLQALLALIVLCSLLPFLLLALRASARDWFYPALLPSGPAETGGLAGGRLRDALFTGGWIALGTGIAATALALPVGRALRVLTGWRRRVATAMAFLPVATPPVALGTGLQLSFLTLGIGGTTWGVLVAHLVPAVAYLSLFFLGVFLAFDPAIEEEARSLGATPIEVWRRVTLPLLRRPVAESVALGFVISWSQVPLTLLVGAGRVRTVPVELMAYLQSGQDQLAAQGALLLVAPAVLAFSGAALVARRARVPSP